MISGIVPSLIQRNPLGVVVSYVSKKSLQVDFQAFIDYFRLTIHLGVICCVEIQLGALTFTQFLLKIASEGRVGIRYNRS